VNPSAKAVILKEDIGTFTNIENSVSFNDSFINISTIDTVEDKPMSSKDEGVNPENVEKIDLQPVIDAFSSSMQSMKDEIIEALKPADPPAPSDDNKSEDVKPDDKPEDKEPELTKDVIRQLIDEVLTEKLAELKPDSEEGKDDDPDAKSDVKAEPLHYSKPKREDFEDDETYNKAIEAFNEFKDELVEDVKADLGAVITKTINPLASGEEDPLDIEKLYEDADEALDFSDLMRKAGVEN
jgi:hypothetical protein